MIPFSGSARTKGIRKKMAPADPLISIITIVYNCERHIEQTIQSVVGQSYKPIEYIIVDGGSTDGTIDIIRKYEDRIDNWISEPDRGISDAMNKGIRLATGDIIAHLHADDYYPDVSVVSSVQNAFASDQKACWLTGGMYIVNELGKFIMEIKVRDYSYNRLANGNIILHPSTFIKRNAFEQAGLFNPIYKYAMDYDLWIRLGRIGDPITLDKPLACFRVHSGSQSISSCDNAYYEEWMIRKNFLKNKPIKMLYHYFLYNVNKRANRKFYRDLLSANPTHKKSLV